MKALKKRAVPIKYTETQINRAKKAAGIVSREREAKVGYSAVLREQSLRGVEEIIATGRSPERRNLEVA